MPICSYRSQYVTAGVIILLQEPWYGCRSQHLFSGYSYFSVNVVFLRFSCDLTFSQSHGLSEPLLPGIFFASSQIKFFLALTSRFIWYIFLHWGSALLSNALHKTILNTGKQYFSSVNCTPIYFTWVKCYDLHCTIDLVIYVYTNKRMLVGVYLDPRRSSSTSKFT